MSAWNVVNRRKRNQNGDPISFSVGNIPDGAVIQELRKEFQRFGSVVDVYMARKKDSGGSNFGFDRFSGVQDVKKFEESFGKITIGHNILVGISCLVEIYGRN